jgi:predicted nucleic acid-binding protein
MSGNKALLDSNVIIEASKNTISLTEIVENYDYLFTSIICYVEVLGFNFKSEQEKRAIEKILNIISIVNLDKEIADLTIDFRKKTKIKLPDALIIATAEKIEADLVTSNISDYKNLTKKIEIVEPKRK